eukprot:1956902-Alexandrium_andersonii.AAC.1
MEEDDLDLYETTETAEAGSLGGADGLPELTDVEREAAGLPAPAAEGKGRSGGVKRPRTVDRARDGERAE